MRAIICFILFLCVIWTVTAIEVPEGARWKIPIYIQSNYTLIDYPVMVRIICDGQIIKSANITFTDVNGNILPHRVMFECPYIRVYVKTNLTVGTNTIYLWYLENKTNYGTKDVFMHYEKTSLIPGTNDIANFTLEPSSNTNYLSRTNVTFLGEIYTNAPRYVAGSPYYVLYVYNVSIYPDNICVGALYYNPTNYASSSLYLPFESLSNYIRGTLMVSYLLTIRTKIAGTETIIVNSGSRTAGMGFIYHEFCRHNNYFSTSANFGDTHSLNTTITSQNFYPAVAFSLIGEGTNSNVSILYFYIRKFVNPEPTAIVDYNNITEVQLPNVRIGNLTVSAFSGNISVQNPTYINFTLSNPTNFNAGAFTVAIYDQTVKIGEYYISNLQAGASVNISHIWYPQYAGQRTIRVVADVNDEVEETSELDNIAEQTIQVLEPQFLVYNLNVYPKSGKEPLEITATAIVENIGGADGYYLATLYINNIAKQQYVLFVPANQTRQVNFTWIFNASGTYSVSISGLYPVYVYVLPQFTPPPIYNPWFNNTTDVLYNFTKGGWYMVAVYAFAPFQEIVFPLLYTFVFGISFIRTRNIATCVFMTLLFTALYVVFVPLWMMKIIYILSAVMIGGVLWMVFGRK